MLRRNGKIKVTKLNCYEDKYQKSASEAREKELYYLQKELAVWALTLVLTVISPMIATAATFAVYVLIDEDNVLTASRSFSVLLLFSALRFPINFAGRLVGSKSCLLWCECVCSEIHCIQVTNSHQSRPPLEATQAYSAVKRIAAFLEREVRTEETKLLGCSTGSTIGGDAPLVLEKASFYIDENGQHPAFRCAETIRVEKGEVLAVCGPVGGGKSSLINGIINEIPASPETILKTQGRKAYVGQSAFILNDTLRENILFRREYNKELYEKVLDACCLRPDIELLAAKDMTMIGERGV